MLLQAEKDYQVAKLKYEQDTSLINQQELSRAAEKLDKLGGKQIQQEDTGSSKFYSEEAEPSMDNGTHADMEDSAAPCDPPPTSMGSFSLFSAVNEQSGVSSQFSQVNAAVVESADTTPAGAGGSGGTAKQKLFCDWITVKDFPERLAVVIHYLIEKGEKEHVKYVLFYVVVQHFKNTLVKSDVSLVTRKWAVEIYTSFLTKVSPTSLEVAHVVLEPLVEKLRQKHDAQSTPTEKNMWSELFEQVVTSVVDRLERAVREFRQVFNTGLQDSYKVNRIVLNTPNHHDNYLPIMEEILNKDMSILLPNKSTVGNDFDASNNSNMVLCQALHTAMIFWRVNVREISLGRSFENISSIITGADSQQTKLERAVHRAMQSFNAEEGKPSSTGAAGGKKGHGFGFFGKKKTLTQSSIPCNGHALIEIRMECLHECAVCGELLWGLPPQGLNCLYCTVSIHNECKEDLQEECENNRKEKVVDQPKKRAKTASVNPKDVQAASESHDPVTPTPPKRSSSIFDFLPKPIPKLMNTPPSPPPDTECDVQAAVDDLSSVNTEDVKPCPVEDATSSTGLVSNQVKQFEKSLSPGSSGDKDEDQKKDSSSGSAKVSRTNSLRDNVSGSERIQDYHRPSSDTPQHSEEIEEARRKAEMGFNASNSSSDKSLAQQNSTGQDDHTSSTEDLSSRSTPGSMHPSIRASTTSLNVLSQLISEEVLNTDEDLQLCTGLDDYKDLYKVDEKLKSMDKDFRDYQYHVHEIIATQMGHVKSLKTLQILYAERWPKLEQEFKFKIGLQFIEPALKAHKSLMQTLKENCLDKQYSETGVIKEIFKYMLQWYSEEGNITQFKKYGASFGSKQADLSQMKNLRSGNTALNEVEDYIKKMERMKTVLWKFLDQANRHPLMNKRRFQDVINVECQRQMRIGLLCNQAVSKLKKVKNKELYGRNELQDLKKTESLSKEVTSYLDKKVSLLKEYSKKMDFSKYEALESFGKFTTENLRTGLHTFLFHREADVKVTSMYPAKGRKKELDIKLLWLENTLFFVTRDESGTLFLKSIEASNAQNAAEKELNMKANPVISINYIVTVTMGNRQPEMTLIWLQEESLLGISMRFEKSDKALPFKNALDKRNTQDIQKKMAAVSRNQTHVGQRTSTFGSAQHQRSASDAGLPKTLQRRQNLSLTAGVGGSSESSDIGVPVSPNIPEENVEEEDDTPGQLKSIQDSMCHNLSEQDEILYKLMDLSSQDEMNNLVDMLENHSQHEYSTNDLLLLVNKSVNVLHNSLTQCVINKSKQQGFTNHLQNILSEVKHLGDIFEHCALDDSETEEDGGVSPPEPEDLPPLDNLPDSASTSTPRRTILESSTVSEEGDEEDIGRDVECLAPTDDILDPEERATVSGSRISPEPMESLSSQISQNEDDTAASVALETQLEEELSDVAKESSGVATDWSDVAKDLSDVAKDSSDVAKDLSDVAKDMSDVAKDLSDVAKESSGVVMDSPDVAKECSDVTKDSSDIVKDSFDVARDSAVCEDTCDVAKDSSIVDIDTPVSSATVAIDHETSSSSSDSTTTTDEDVAQWESLSAVKDSSESVELPPENISQLTADSAPDCGPITESLENTEPPEFENLSSRTQ